MAYKNIVTEEIETVLRASKLDGIRLQLPAQLETKLYKKVNAVIECIGFKWSKKNRTHIYTGTEGARHALEQAISSGFSLDKVKIKKKATQAFYTPPALAQQLVDLGDVYKRHVLEPSAGLGAIADCCIKNQASGVDCIESDFQSATALTEKGYHVRCVDFLNEPVPANKYDRVVMNPPFTRGQDLKHFEHALSFVERGGTLVSILARHTRSEINNIVVRTVGKKSVLWMFPIEKGSFKESGTMIETIMVKVLIP